MEAQIQLRSTTNFELREALLVYRSDRKSYGAAGPDSFVTKHSVKLIDHGAPSLGPGVPLGKSDITELIKQLRGSLPIEFLPATILVRTQETVVWWTPATVRPMFYAKAKGEELVSLSGKKFPQPALIFRAFPGSLEVRAIATSDRPALDTPLFRAPYWNVNDSGMVCLGSTNVPHEVAIESLPRWEHAFFESEFTHPNAVNKLTEHPGGFVGLWKSLIGKKRFPAEYLAGAKETLAQFIER